MNKTSHYFAQLYDAYAAEIEDNRTDSEGKVVLKKRLDGLRSQFGGYLPMMDENPEMVAVVFHDAFTFDVVDIVRTAVGRDPDDASFPSWALFEDTLTVAPWAEGLVDMALAEEGGDRFLVIAGCLEYIRSTDARQAAAAAADTDAEGEGGERTERGEGDDDGDEPVDLAEQGDDWLSQQGFDPQR